MVTLSFGRLRFRPECVVIWGVQGLHGLMFLILISRRLAFPANIWVPYGLPIWGVQPGSVWGPILVFLLICPINNLSVIQGRVFLDLTSTKLE